MPSPKKYSKKPSVRTARRVSRVVKTSAKTTTIQAKKATSPKKVVIVPSLDKSRGFFLAALVIVAVAGAVMLMPKLKTNSTTASTLSHVVTYKGEDGKTALDLLKAHHQVAAQQFSIGAFVTSVDGISAPPNYFWAFTVNGQPSNVGADQYVTKNADTLVWQLERIQ